MIAGQLAWQVLCARAQLDDFLFWEQLIQPSWPYRKTKQNTTSSILDRFPEFCIVTQFVRSPPSHAGLGRTFQRVASSAWRLAPAVFGATTTIFALRGHFLHIVAASLNIVSVFSGR